MNSIHFDHLLDESVRIHGHLCPGQVLGVRMAMHGLAAIGVHDPKGRDRKKLYLIVEIDRCATDALQSVTGCSLGRRTMRFIDYGKMAATFVNLETRKAVRVLAVEEARGLAKSYFPGIANERQCQLEAYRVMSDEELFRDQEVTVWISPWDLPGKPLGRVKCDRCGEYVQNTREEFRDGKVLCRPCVRGCYYGHG